MEAIANEVLDLIVKGHNLPADTLHGLLDGPPTFLVFLRHFG